MSYHKDLPQSWIEIIEKDVVLKGIWEEHDSEYEAVPEFLFGLIGDELERLRPVFALYGEPGIDMYEKIVAMKTIAASDSDEEPEGKEELVKELAKEYIRAMNDLYRNEFEEEPILDEDAEIILVRDEERDSVIEELQESWDEEEETPENEFNEVICDWYICELEYKEGCKELKNLLWEAVYNLEEDYKISYYLMWSLADRPAAENPYLPFYKLWCMGYTASFPAEDKVLVY